MKVLFLAPQAFFIERGTPIAVKFALETLEQRDDIEIDLLTYHEGESVSFKKVVHHRANVPNSIKDIGPGLSLKKIFADFFFFFDAIKLINHNKPTHIHAVEESVFMALIFKKLFNIPYIYDMDSGLVTQSVDKWRLLKILAPILKALEKSAISNAELVIPVCDSLVDLAKDNAAKEIFKLSDISFYDDNVIVSKEKNLRSQFNFKQSDLVLLYVGNLEVYQGIDLLIDGIKAFLTEENLNLKTVIIGGSKEDVLLYQNKIKHLELEEQVFLLGPKPVEDLSIYLKQADILASPRTQGTNTPMKVYSYLHSGNVVLATDRLTNTQVMNSNTAMLHAATAKDLAAKLSQLYDDSELRETLGNNAKADAEKHYTKEAFYKQLNKIYDFIKKKSIKSDKTQE